MEDFCHVTIGYKGNPGAPGVGQTSSVFARAGALWGELWRVGHFRLREATQCRGASEGAMAEMPWLFWEMADIWPWQSVSTSLSASKQYHYQPVSFSINIR